MRACANGSANNSPLFPMLFPTKTLVLVFLYLLLVGGLCLWRLRTLKGREGQRPVGEDEKLRRLPGDGLRRRLARLDEQGTDVILLLLVLPPVAGIAPLALGQVLPDTAALGWLLTAVALFVLALVLCLRRLVRVTTEFRDSRVGLAGERFVADNLAPLAGEGFAIFHDVPCQGATGAFNLDHVVVGGGGIAVIETKTRRKRKRDDVAKDYQVIYDGSALIWPGGFRDGASVAQAVGNARWLSEYLKRELNIAVEPLPVLTVPGWWVEARAKEPVAALNPKWLARALPARVPRTLTAEQSELIVRRLTSLCQDVDFNDPV